MLVDDLLPRAALGDDPKRRREVAVFVLDELEAPDDPVERYQLDRERWGLRASSSRADRVDPIVSDVTYGDPGDGAE